MAINSYTPVSSNGGYRIIPETGTYSGEASVFSPEETFRLQAQGYSDLGDNVMSTIYGDLANDLGQYSGYANSTLGAYDKLLNFMSGNENKLQTVAGNLYKDLVGDINNQRNYVNDMFGPQGTLTSEINTYYDDLGNYLATDAGRQAAKIVAQGMHSGASLGAIRAQQNEAYNESFGRYIQAKEQQINAKEKIASNLINFMSTLRKEYGETTNQYIIEMYKRAYDLYNKIALSVASDLDSYNKLRASSGGNSNSILESLGLTSREDGTYIDNAGNKYSIGADGKLVKVGNGSAVTTSDAQSQVGLTPKGSKASNVDWAGLGWKAMIAPYTYLNPVYRVGKGTEGLINSMK